LRADIDYGFYEAHTTFGRLGVKVWIYKGEVIHSRAEREAAARAAARAPKTDRPRRMPRAPHGEVTKSSVDSRAAAATTKAVEDAPPPVVSPETPPEGSEA
jgi:small subunit ribosomal protein S3